jgi:hypothetical protein
VVGQIKGGEAVEKLISSVTGTGRCFSLFMSIVYEKPRAESFRRCQVMDNNADFINLYRYTLKNTHWVFDFSDGLSILNCTKNANFHVSMSPEST